MAFGDGGSSVDAGYGASKNPGAAYSDKDAGTGYAAPDDAGADQPSSLFGDGVNLQPSYSSNGNADLGWNLMKTVPTIHTVRIMIEPARNQEAVRWIAEAQNNGYEVIVCYNVAGGLGSDDPARLQDAADWWVYNYEKLKGKKGITINIRNEWGGHGLDAQTFATAYNAAITRIRTVYQQRLVIDAPGYGQGATRLYEAVKTVPSPIVDRNIMLSVHVYPSAYDAATGKALQGAALKKLDATGVPCIIGEFGSHTDGSAIASWISLVGVARSLKWPALAWCWAADGTGGKADLRNMNMIDSPRMQQRFKAGLDAEFDPFVAGKPVAYTRAPYFNEVAPFLK